MPTPHKNRRRDDAETTRLAITTAARQLFSQKGYFATTVEEIAAKAQVAPTTVYAVSGGKQGLLRTLADTWSQAPIIATTINELLALTDPNELLQQLSAITRTMRENYGDIIRILLTTAPHNRDAAHALKIATQRYRNALTTIATHLHKIGGTHPHTTTEQTAHILWFYFGYNGYTTLINENKWTYDQAEPWLTHQTTTALQTPPHQHAHQHTHQPNTKNNTPTTDPTKPISAAGHAPTPSSPRAPRQRGSTCSGR
ncbi:TetR/AcrR family transcriptional regulator [Streptomyces buecherae]|uniref:TetR/AcrR family transcriptional regulator n=1 Tax=Streptomyces buecherae TaxID=2763006 RepID=UPI0033C5D2F9